MRSNTPHTLLLFPLLWLCLWCGKGELSAQEKAATAFLEMPDSITPHFDRDSKSRLLEQYTLKATGRSSEAVRNIYGGNSEIQSLTDTRLVVRIDDSTLFEMKVFRTRKRKEPVVGVIYTDTTAPAISVFAFYAPHKGWERLSTPDLIALPKPEEFLLSEILRDDLEVKKALVERGLWSYTASFSDSSETLLLTPTTFTDSTALALYPGMLSKLVPGLTYEWNRKAFVKKDSRLR